MEIMVNEAFASLTDLDKLTDNQKVLLAVVSEIYTAVPMDHYIFFNQHDLEVLSNLKRLDPTKPWAKNNYPWFFECFDYQFHDYQNLGIRPLDLNHRMGYDVAGKPTYPVTITDEHCQKMWWYLLGVFGSREIISDFKLQKRVPNGAYQIHRSYIGELNHRLLKRDYTADGSWSVG